MKGKESTIKAHADVDYCGADSQLGRAEEERSVVFTERTGAAGGGKSTNTPGVCCANELCLEVLYFGTGWMLLTFRIKKILLYLYH